MARDPFEARPDAAYSKLAALLSAQPTGAPPLKRGFGSQGRPSIAQALGPLARQPISTVPRRAASQKAAPPRKPTPSDQLVTPGRKPMPSAGIAQLGLTPQEENLYQHHVTNMRTGRGVTNPDGSVSTVRSIGVTGPGGREYVIPTIWDGKILPAEQAVARAQAVGWDRWPSYDTSDAADARYDQMHEYIARDVGQGREPNIRMAPPRKPGIVPPFVSPTAAAAPAGAQAGGTGMDATELAGVTPEDAAAVMQQISGTSLPIWWTPPAQWR